MVVAISFGASSTRLELGRIDHGGGRLNGQTQGLKTLRIAVFKYGSMRTQDQTESSPEADEEVLQLMTDDHAKSASSPYRHVRSYAIVTG
jgi:hypothetical protein